MLQPKPAGFDHDRLCDQRVRLARPHLPARLARPRLQSDGRLLRLPHRWHRTRRPGRQSRLHLSAQSATDTNVEGVFLMTTYAKRIAWTILFALLGALGSSHQASAHNNLRTFSVFLTGFDETHGNG